MLGGAAAGDYDNDGWVDLFVTRLDNNDILFRNRGNDPCGVHLGFEDVSAAAGLTAVHNSNGCAWGDIDNDGDLDLYLTTVDCPIGDLDGDCKVTLIDVALMFANWLECGVVCD
jgi:hypothetical protein